MSRSRSYTREMRNKHIARKKRIIKKVYSGNYYVSYNGMLSKGKVHCSCNLCAFAKYNKHQRTESDMRRIASCDEKMKEFYQTQKEKKFDCNEGE